MPQPLPLWLRLAQSGMLRLNDAGDAGGGDSGDNDAVDQDDTVDQDAGNDSDAGSNADGQDDDTDSDKLGPKGQQAIDRMKARVKSETARRKAAEAALAAATDKDDATRIQREADEKATAKANARILRGALLASAKVAKLHEPSDALSHVDLDQFEVDDNGDFDQAEIDSAIADLLTKRPYLAAQGGTGPKPDFSQGGGKKTAKGTPRDALADFFEDKLAGL